MPPKAKPKASKEGKKATTSLANVELNFLLESDTLLPVSRSTPNPLKTPNEQTNWRYVFSRPLVDPDDATSTFTDLSEKAKLEWVCARLLSPEGARERANLTARAQDELWKHVNEAPVPLRWLRLRVDEPGSSSLSSSAPAAPAAGRGGLPEPTQSTHAKGGLGGYWGRDRLGRDVGEYSFERFETRFALRADLTELEAESRRFRRLRDRAVLAAAAARTRIDDREAGKEAEGAKKSSAISDEALKREREVRAEMASMRDDLYGERVGTYAQDLEWDDVVPIAHMEPEAALAAIAYPEDYAEAISYLRAVMVKKEYSKRCLRLTEHIIEMNPSHYTVWLFRAAIVFALQIPLMDELAWLNDVAMRHLKNYQIWHHRHLLVERLYPALAAEEEEKGDGAIARFVASEREVLTTILAEDAKNYHVWSYRSYLVAKLGDRFADQVEVRAIETLIDDDVRNNSAWSHRFLVVFGGSTYDSVTGRGVAPAVTGGRNEEEEEGKQQQRGRRIGALDPDPRIPAAFVAREIEYAQAKIRLAPQNQSAWNYLRGALAKGSQPLASVEAFAAEFVSGIAEGEADEEEQGEEDVRSTHALDLLADACAEKGDKERADLYLRRLADKWDRIRKGYWEWRRKRLAEEA